ncbi:M24 family metallopeptidase [Mycetocola miduiensis]|uniref:Xaa-Pro aminopeptidase n=1 Tax=Mycetocola miduiensis TaxID=995034 RepID=A0A1I5AFI2_9MICO|nr:Xaa-Pro peptidase family protein [Mycetocola miduiensis]SFN61175.1 Xaa-Pro aminopeptidase [Mycetocola miduiensis]
MLHTDVQDITVDEYRGRVAKTQAKMSEEGYDLLLAWSDSYRMSNVRWLANYRAFDGVFPYPAMVVLPQKGDPILLAEGSLVSYAQDCTWMNDVRGIRQQLANVLREYAASGTVRTVAIAGYKYLAAEFLDIIKASLPDSIEIVPTGFLDYFKSIKSEAEIRNMAVAGRLADIGIEAVRQNTYEGVSERELARAAYAAMYANGADTSSFDIMVQTGENSANYFLAHPTDRKLQHGETILIDMGCRYNGYSSDMARGVSFGPVSRDAQRMQETCLEAWQAGYDALRVGMTGEEADVAADDIIRAAGYSHSAGEGRGCAHGTGMDPEEEGPVIGPGSDWVLTANQSFAFEVTLLLPGIGGTRIEDVVILREEGAQSLTHYDYVNNWDWVTKPADAPVIPKLNHPIELP